MHTDQLPQRTREAYGAIKRQIIELAMPPGAPFTEGEIAASLRLSKTPVREALVRLRQEGLVEAVARSGYRVRPVTLKNARELFHLQELLAVEAAGLAAEHGDDLELVGNLQRLSKAAGSRRAPDGELLRVQTQFFVTVGLLAGNDLLARFIEMVWEQLERMFNVAVSLGVPVRDMVFDHEDLLSAVKAGDAAAARTAAREGTKAIQRAVVDVLLSSNAVLSANIAAAGDD